MAESAQSYDEFADFYHLIFKDWEESITRQAEVLGGILFQQAGCEFPLRVLDCACGIGTQSLGLASKGFDVEACDISLGAVKRARAEAAKRQLKVMFSVASMTKLDAITSGGFDAVICIDNALPHLEDDELLQSAKQILAKLRDGGSLLGSIRDYDTLMVERPTVEGPSFYSDNGRRRIVLQVWDWLDERRYRLHLYITQNTDSGWVTRHFTTTYRAVLRAELSEILKEAGFKNIRWLLPLSIGFYQPLFVAER